MKIDHRDSAPRPLAAALVLLAALAGGGCVSKARYDDATAELKYYQRLYQDLESYQGKLEAENAELTGELGLYRTSGPVEASMTDIDRRMEELDALAQRIGGSTGGVTVLQVEGGYGLRMPEAVLFESGSAEIRPEGRELLRRMAGEITSSPYERIWVRGHTDSDPVKKPATRERFPHGNLQLSAARAVEVAAFLGGEGGIDTHRMVVAGFGPSEPVAKNDTAANKERNRRVEVLVLEDEDAAGVSGSH